MPFRRSRKKMIFNQGAELHAIKPPDSFSRTLSENYTSIISVCEVCGEVLQGSVSTGLHRQEIEHYLSCHGEKKPPTSIKQ